MPSNPISGDLFFKIFLGPQTPSISMLCMLNVLHTIAFMTTHHPKFCIHTALQLVGLTTEKLLPTALRKNFRGTPENHEKHESLAQQIFPHLW